MASLAEISKRAGVSIATASRVLNGSKHPVSEKTRERVTAVAEEMGYSPSALARALVKRNSKIIGVIVGDIVDPYFGEIARGVADVAGREGYLTMVCNADRQPELELEHVKALRDYHAAGIIFAGSGQDGEGPSVPVGAAVEAARAGGSSIVAVAPRGFESQRAVFDNTRAVFDMTDYMVALGHSKIVYVDGDKGLISTEKRRAGYLDAMEKAGLEPNVVSGGYDYEVGFNVGLRLIASGGHPDAVIGANDEVAIGILTSFRQAGIDVPGDVSVAGIGGLRPSRYLGLTTISAPTYELGTVAAQAILSGQEPGAAGTDVVLPHRLTPRTTTRRR